jgi:glycosyltransferase involved in cell wall biosynthesis
MSPEPLSRIVYLTAGAAGMYCGSCMHDNTLARALKQTGVDVQLVPIYTPIRTDEHDVSVDQVFFGGINVYLQQTIPLLRHLPRFVERWLDSPWLIRRVTSRASATNPQNLGDLTISMLRGIDGNQRKEVRRLGDWMRDVAKPELLVLTNMLIGGGIPHWKRELGIPIAVLLQGDDQFLDYLPDSHRRQATALIQQLAADVDLFLSHSSFYADRMAERFALDRSQVVVTPLGIDTRDFESLEPQRPRDAARTIGYLARLSPEKGLHLLVDAFLELKRRPHTGHIKLLLGGWLAENQRDYANRQFDRLRKAGWEHDFQYLGVLDRAQKLAMLGRCHVFTVPCEFLEPKGIYALEAMAAGIPVVLPAHGVFPELLAQSQTGWQFPPGNTIALADAWQAVLSDEPARWSAAQTARAYVLKHRTAQQGADQTLSALRKVASQRSANSVDPP